MKQHLLLLCLSFFSLTSLFAQKELTFSAHAGANYTNFLDSDFLIFDYKYGVGYTAGVGLEVGFTENWSLVTGVFYDRKVVKLDFTIFVSSEMGNEVIDISDSFTFNYIVVPALARYTFRNKKTPLFINGGLYTGYLVKTNLSFDTPTSGFNALDAGLAIGVGMHIPISQKNNFIIELRDYVGIADINSSSTKNSLHSVQLLLGITL